MDRKRGLRTLLAGAWILMLALPVGAQLNDGDINDDGYIDWLDMSFLYACFIYPTSSGPAGPTLQDECRNFDFDDDHDADLADFAVWQNMQGHAVRLRNVDGDYLTVDSTEPYSPRKTCGGCHVRVNFVWIDDYHDFDVIGAGNHFQVGRTDSAGNVDVREDWAGDGRTFNLSGGMYGEWAQPYKHMLAPKSNDNESQIDMGSFAWVRDCGGCHPGGGPGAHDRDGEPYFDPSTGTFGWEAAMRDPQLDGDYADIDYATGTIRQAPWDVTGTSEPDCLLCHRAAWSQSPCESRHWRSGVLGTADALVDSQGTSVAAYLAASTAGQGWFSQFSPYSDPPVLQIDYSQGVADGSINLLTDDFISLPTHFLTTTPKDYACVSCHVLGERTGSLWFDDRDVHYRKFNNHSDDDPLNDIRAIDSGACATCHTGDVAHKFAHGGSFELSARDDEDYQDFRTCRDCHLTEIAEGIPNPNKHPEAPDVPGDVPIHNVAGPTTSPMAQVSCQGCHITSSWALGKVYSDTTVDVDGWTHDYYSADPLDPTDPDRTIWFPSLAWRTDSDGVERLFPASRQVMIYFGEWHDGGTPGDLSDDVIAPIADWRVDQVVDESVLATITDDNSDGHVEINRPEEVLACLTALAGNDSYGRPVAVNPVLVRGPRVWYASNGTVDHFEHADTGIPIEAYAHRWGKNHNVVAAELAFGAGPNGCADCHADNGALAPVIDRLILVDPYGLDGQPEYTTVRALTGVNPPE